MVRTIVRVQEAFSVRKKELGEVPFKQTSLIDPYIQQLIARQSQKTGVPADKIIQSMQEEITKLDELKGYSKFLYETIAKNAVASAAFKLIDESTKVSNVHFSPIIFNDLVRMVEHEHSQFFPLRAPNDNEYIFHINPILMPSKQPEFQKFNEIDTAAATADGDFIFNVPFMQKLIEYAHIEALKPEGKKYFSHGGPIPDEYGYIEFLIVHELLHYSYGDFAQGQLYDQFTPKEHNWAADFRSNYMLTKSGYSQLPIGLFSDHINYDRQHSYYDMVKLVHDEMQKLPKDLRQDAQDLLDELSDEHGHPDQQQKGGAKAGETGKDGKPVDPDAVHKEIEQKMGQKKDAQETPGQGPGSGSGKGGSPGKGGDTGLNAIDTTKVKPKYNWKTLLSKCISSAKHVVDTSYAKPARRNVTGAAMTAQIGASAIKPGEKILPQDSTKLALVFDTSGSMGGMIATVLAEAKNLLRQHSKAVDTLIGVIFFAGAPQYFEVNIGRDYYAKISSMAELGKADDAAKVKGFMKVFDQAGSGGTDFSETLSGNLAAICGNGFNVMIFSDQDMTEAGNFKNLKNLYIAHKTQTFFIAIDKTTFVTICNKLGLVPGTFSHF